MTNRIKTASFSRPLLQHLLAGTAVIWLMSHPGMAEEALIDGCALVNGVLPDNCAHANAGTVVAVPAGANTETDAAVTDLGPYGFAITVEAAAPGSTARPAVAGTDQAQSDMRRVDRLLDAAGVAVTYDGLGIRPRLAVATDDQTSTAIAGKVVTFRASSNYPAWVARAEVRVMDADDPTKVVATLPVAPNGTVDWPMPGQGPQDMVYALRVYDTEGRFDETRTLPLSRSAKVMAPAELAFPVVAAGEGEDMTARRAIPVRGGAVTVSGTTAAGGSVLVMGERAVADASGAFVIQRILPPGTHDIAVGVAGGGVTRTVDIPKNDWFYVGLIDLTHVRESGADSYTLGRVAGYAKGNTASGYTITASLDTREGELKYLFRDLDEKNPDRVLRRIEGSDVYPTFGDDSVAFEDAPTSGKFYLRVERDRSSLTWGDFKADEGASRFVRSDRTLYGLQLVHESVGQTSFGEAKLKFAAYGASPDRLVQRDVLRGTGGSAYFLKRQDILSGTETIYIQYRDPVSGNVMRADRLTLGEDYEIDYFQGVILLKRPLPGSAGGTLGGDRPLGSTDVNLVAQYEFVPTTGTVEGYSVGGRLEGWVTDQLRLGLSAARETTGVADNKIVGADVMLRYSEATYVSFDYAHSEGPGFGTAFSFNGGLDLDPAIASPSSGPSAGALGVPADAFRVEVKVDLAELTSGAVAGEIAGYFDRKEAGFVSSDYDIETAQDSWGLSGRVDLSDRTELVLAWDDFSNADGKARRDARLGLGHTLNDRWTVEAALVDTDRSDPAGSAAENGGRTDLAVKLIWSRDEDLSVWAFGQATLRQSGGLPQNDRYGLGTKMRLTDRLSFEGEISDGSLGGAGLAELIWANGAGSEAHLGYRLDPLRSAEDGSFTGTDGGSWVLGSTTRVNDQISYRGENLYDLKGNEKSLTTAYGVRYTPNDRWAYDANLEFGETILDTGDTFKRRAVGLSFDYANEDFSKAGLKLEYRVEDSSDAALKRDTWLASGYAQYKVSDDWRLMFDLDALVSDSDQSSVRDGRYVEANVGYAYRPADNDRLNMLFRYTYLYDLPGQDQVNIDGDVAGPKQKSHIMSFDFTYDLNERWTVGGKYGYRKGQVADRGSAAFTASTADLLVARADFHVVHNWDVLLEGRLLNLHEADVTEKGALAAVYRHFGNNMKLGVGYQWGGVSDDLRSIDGEKEGVFLNIVGKF